MQKNEYVETERIPKYIDYSITNNTQRVLIGADLATKLLSKNRVNRPIVKSSLAMIRRHINNNTWREFNPDPILVNINGELLNGQHRLTEIVANNACFGFYVLVERDVNLQPMDLMMDVGRKRSDSDITGINTSVTAIIRYFLTNIRGTGATMHRMNVEALSTKLITVNEVENFYNKYIKEDIELVELLSKKQRPLWSCSSMKSIAMAYYLKDLESKKYIKKLVEALISKNIDKHPILQKAYMRTAEGTWSPHALAKLAYVIFNIEHAEDNRINLPAELSLKMFFEEVANEIGLLM